MKSTQYNDLKSIIERKLRASSTQTPRELLRLLASYLTQLLQIASSELVGVYLRGSLACGGFDPRTSDVDVFVVLKEPMDTKLFDILKVAHEELRDRFPLFGPRLEAAYLSRKEVRAYKPNTKHPTTVKRMPLYFKQHESDWILERAATIEHGIALIGPTAEKLIDHVSKNAIQKAAEETLDRWITWGKDENNPDWCLPVIHKAFVVQSICRALFTASYGEMVSKEAAVDWAQTWLSEPWSTTVRNSRHWRLQSGKQIQLRPEIRRFLGWVEENKSEILHGRHNNP